MLAQRTMAQPASNRRVYPFPGSYTFTVPTGATNLVAIVVSGGGFGGQGSGSPNFLLGGGGGAGFGVRATRAVSAGQTINVTVGTGGSSFFGGGSSTVTHAASGDQVNVTGGAVGGTTSVGTPGAGGSTGSFTASGWTVTHSQPGNAGNSGQPASNGNGGAFPLFFGISGDQFGSGSYAFGCVGMGDAIPSGQGGNGIVILEWS